MSEAENVAQGGSLVVHVNEDDTAALDALIERINWGRGEERPVDGLELVMRVLHGVVAYARGDGGDIRPGGRMYCVRDLVQLGSGVGVEEQGE